MHLYAWCLVTGELPVVKLFPRCDYADPRRRITRVMGFRVGVVAAAVGALAAAASAQAAPANRLVAFNSCPALLSYAKTHAAPFVGPYGFGAQAGGVKGAPGIAVLTGSAAAKASSADGVASPTQGVDYSGTNVQETSVDEPDMVKT